MKENGGIWVCGGETLIEDYDVELPYTIKQVKLTKNESKHYYDGFCNTQIWPLFHYFPARYKLHVKDWSYYKQVNQKFANQIIDILEPDDCIWVHDYQLILLPKLLREKGVKNKIGFFLHIPFPTLEIYRIFPKRYEIIESLLNCDLIGFHTKSYVKNFMDCVEYFMSDQVEINSNIIKHDNNQKTKVIALPISIDFRHIDKVAQSAEVISKAEELQKIFDGQIIGLGIDRLDYSKGIIEKFEGLELFLEQNPEYIKKLSFIQIAVPTRSDVPEYAKLKRKVDETVGRINGKFSKEGWSPIHYIYSNLKPQDIIAYYKCADFIIVSALRDGLNLVAKEYVASRSNNSGALILSEFTGAAEEIPHKFLINPYDTNSIATAIKRTLESDEKQKILQMAELRSYVKENDIFHWLDAFLRELY